MITDDDDWLPGAGHNQGPVSQAGRRARILAWKQALDDRTETERSPEVVRRRVKRARELGLSYAVYASIHMTAGRDIGAYLFSSNALGVFANGGPPPAKVTARLAALQGVRRIGLAVPPLTPDQLAERVPALDAVFAAPAPYGGNAAMRQALALAQGKMPAASIVAVTALPREDEWVMAGRLGGVLRADSLFG
ncbi:hypothetical protein DL237_08735 [Pseudooceanicola sediminis]|uniref:Uncharacterized protein n=1 Tax=Pseudooceanicola sediminis TaxID=2211117 RepID=A0A399J1R5_9RHOB|nr:hypothetical protein [Pseudooceanicola sediminis]KAA2316311.1 hypothetical protein E0K93_05590 [Puniceibacterium sp. HSS470]RII39224.1 hypothetical protein DL237_08735 [Pseudooceanicola sediminis]